MHKCQSIKRKVAERQNHYKKCGLAILLAIIPLSVTLAGESRSSKGEFADLPYHGEIENLASDKKHLQEEARRELKKAGWKALPNLVDALDHKDSKIVSEVEKLISEVLFAKLDLVKSETFASLIHLGTKKAKLQTHREAIMNEMYLHLFDHRLKKTSAAMQALKKLSKTGTVHSALFARALRHGSESELSHLYHEYQTIKVLSKSIKAVEKEIETCRISQDPKIVMMMDLLERRRELLDIQLRLSRHHARMVKNTIYETTGGVLP